MESDKTKQPVKGDNKKSDKPTLTVEQKAAKLANEIAQAGSTQSGSDMTPGQMGVLIHKTAFNARKSLNVIMKKRKLAFYRKMGEDEYRKLAVETAEILNETFRQLSPLLPKEE